jgi:hypothetical protein
MITTSNERQSKNGACNTKNPILKIASRTSQALHQTNLVLYTDYLATSIILGS